MDKFRVYLSTYPGGKFIVKWVSEWMDEFLALNEHPIVRSIMTRTSCNRRGDNYVSILLDKHTKYFFTVLAHW
jgi:hypothetical protein